MQSQKKLNEGRGGLSFGKKIFWEELENFCFGGGCVMEGINFPREEEVTEILGK